MILRSRFSACATSRVELADSERRCLRRQRTRRCAARRSHKSGGPAASPRDLPVAGTLGQLPGEASVSRHGRVRISSPRRDAPAGNADAGRGADTGRSAFSSIGTRRASISSFTCCGRTAASFGTRIIKPARRSRPTSRSIYRPLPDLSSCSATGPQAHLAEIPDDSWLLRRIHPTQVIHDKNAGHRRPSSGAFKDEAMSVDSERLLHAAGKDWSFSLEGYDGYSLANFRADVATSLGQAVVHCPVAGNDFHAEARGKKTGAVSRQLAGASSWVYVEELDGVGLRP